MEKIITNIERLRIKSKPVDGHDLVSLTRRLRAANDTAWIPGCGLAAIQIGIPLRFAWFKWGENEFILVNPEIVEYKSKQKIQTEACLSIPHKWVKVKRFYKIKYLSDGRPYTAKGQKAQIIQHEINHMDGILIIDK